jgi:hypothetical protein
MSELRKALITSLAVGVALVLSGCASGREFWTYVVEPPVEKPIAREQGTTPSPGVVSPHTIRVSYSDGGTATDVQIPVLNSGQQIVIDHKNRAASEAVHLAPLAPASADKSVEEAYVRSGKSVSQKAQPVSITKTQGLVKKLVKQGNLSLALEYVEQLLQRYPQHVESLRTKGSILLKMGEREAALESYRKAEEIEPDTQVRSQIQELEKGLH